jgi:hypothetical protein
MGTRMLCQYLELSTFACIKVPDAQKITNCLLYSPVLSCELCMKDFLSENGKCSAVSKKVENCLVYKSDGKCQVCESNFIQALNDPEKCSPVPKSISNCFLFSYASCDKCKDGYVLDRSRDSQLKIDLASLEKFLVYSQSDYLIQSIRSQVFTSKVCFQKEYGCDPKTDEKCLGCMAGEYLEGNVCKQNPVQRILNCQFYSDLTTCSECSQGFLLKNNKCEQLTPIFFCEKYDNKAAVSTCLQCSTEYYLSANQCKARQLKIISSCKNFDPNNDNCLLCSSGKALNTQRTACFDEIPFCLVHEATIPTSTTLSCSVCIDGYYTFANGSNPKTCVKGTLANCVKYVQSNVNNCDVCEQGYYKFNFQCFPHVTIPFCKKYDGVVSSQCVECNDGYFLFPVLDVCVPSDKRPNCEKHSQDMYDCIQCIDRFYVNQDGNCVPIPQILGNCLMSNISGTSCTKCGAGFVLVKYPTYNACSLAPNFLTTFGSLGESMTTTPWDFESFGEAINDGTCQSLAYPVEFKGNDLFCIQNTDLKFYSNFRMIDKCKRYCWNGDQTKLVCCECLEGHYLSGYDDNDGLINDLTCQSSCDLEYNVIVPMDLLGLHNICLPKSSLPSSLSSLTQCRVVGKPLISPGEGVWEPNSTTKNAKCLLWDSSTKLNGFDLSGSSSYANHPPIEKNKINILNWQVFSFGNSYLNPSFQPAYNYHSVDYVGYDPNKVLYSGVKTKCAVFFKMTKGSAYATTGRNPDITNNNGITEDIVCLQCQFGSVPTYVELSGGKYFYAPKCVDKPSDFCNKAVLLGGLPGFLNAALSCHSCQSNRVPTLQMEYLGEQVIGNIGFLLQYSFPDTFGTNNDLGFQCNSANSPFTSLITTDLSKPPTIFLDCGVYGIFTRIATSRTPSSVKQNFCLACLHGFYPKYYGPSGSFITPTTLPSYIVTECISSDNCDLSSPQKPFNSCGKCITPSAGDTNPVYFAYTDTLLANCLPSVTTNCFLLKEVSQQKNHCQVCLSGYFLNVEGFCEVISIPNLATDSTAYNFGLDLEGLRQTLPTSTPSNPNNISQLELSYIRLLHLLSFTGTPNGPAECKAQYVIAALPRQIKRVCSKSSFLKSEVAETNNNFAKHCSNYEIVDTTVPHFKCVLCDSDKLIDDENSKCHDKLDDCVVVKKTTPTLCHLCDEGFSNVNGVCMKPKIENCKSIDQKETFDSRLVPVCQECNSGFYLDLSDSVCKKGSILNCDKYALNEPTVCDRCLPGYGVVRLKQNLYFCFHLNGALNNCDINTSLVVSDKGLTGGHLGCKSCLNTPYETFGLRRLSSLSNLNNPSRMCLKYPQVDKCVSYDYTTSLSTSSLKCSKCQDGFYLDRLTYYCVQRRALLEDCIEYDLFSEKCLKCKPDKILTSDSSPTCIEVPKGVPNCIRFSDANTCVQCINGYFLQNNLCFESEVVENCLTYSAQKVCFQCKQSFALDSQKFCVPVKAKNCLTAQSPTACLTCSSGKGLTDVTENSVVLTNCVDINLPNCAKSTTVSPFTCLICNPKFFLSGNECKPVAKEITNCLIYESSFECSQCEIDYGLFINKLKCDRDIVTNYGDPDCERTLLNDLPICAFCNPTFELVNGLCLPISRDNSLCFAFDSSTPRKCIICSPKDSFMNSQQVCISNSIADTPFVPDDDPTPSPRKVAITSFWISLAVVAFVN